MPAALSRAGVVFVVLTEVQAPDLIMPAIADGLELPREQGGDVSGQVRAYLREWRGARLRRALIALTRAASIDP
ncbi:MAG: hypothetical protein M3Z20_06105 [Chloroflexota bacterium]|nr:hypothetical protein [Chloroflexota bacterium]